MVQVGNSLIRRTWWSVQQCFNNRLHVASPWSSARALEGTHLDGRGARRLHVASSWPSARALAGTRLDGRVCGSDGNKSRFMSSLDAENEEFSNPFGLIAEDLKKVYSAMMAMLQNNIKDTTILKIATSYHDTVGDVDTAGYLASFSILYGKTLNYHMFKDGTLKDAQVKGAAIVDLIASVTLIRDDMIDNARLRLGKPTAHCFWNPNKVVQAGNMVIGIYFGEAGKLGNDVNLSCCQMHEISQKGQFMSFREVLDNDLLGHYLKTQDYKSATFLQHVAISQARAVRAKESLVEIMSKMAYNIGFCAGVVDDIQDFEGDLRNGIVTAPAIFASREHPELKEIILRKYSKEGDVEKTIDLVRNSNGMDETRAHARRYHSFAMEYLHLLADSPYRRALEKITRLLLLRMELGARVNKQVDV